VTKEIHDCEGFSWNGYANYKCRYNGKFEDDGKWYCKNHHEPSIQAKRRARDETFNAKWERDMAISDRRNFERKWFEELASAVVGYDQPTKRVVARKVFAQFRDAAKEKGYEYE